MMVSAVLTTLDEASTLAARFRFEDLAIVLGYLYGGCDAVDVVVWKNSFNLQIPRGEFGLSLYCRF